MGRDSSTTREYVPEWMKRASEKMADQKAVRWAREKAWSSGKVCGC